jgi:hypothetical protein
MRKNEREKSSTRLATRMIRTSRRAPPPPELRRCKWDEPGGDAEELSGDGLLIMKQSFRELAGHSSECCWDKKTREQIDMQIIWLQAGSGRGRAAALFL